MAGFSCTVGNESAKASKSFDFLHFPISAAAPNPVCRQARESFMADLARCAHGRYTKKTGMQEGGDQMAARTYLIICKAII